MRVLIAILCLPLSNVVYSQACIDSDGDGWGWNGVETCTNIEVNNCVDNDGDGWGWDGSASCRIGEIAITSCKDPDGDGWGWNGVESCKPGEDDNPVPTRLTLAENGDELNARVYPPREYGSIAPVVSDDGRFILFNTFADNVVANDTNNKSDVFLRDTVTGVVKRISQGPGGVEANNHSTAEAVSTSGRFSVFSSYANNIVADNIGGLHVYLYDAAQDVMKRISIPQSGDIGNRNAMISLGGGTVVYQSRGRFVGEGSSILRYDVSNGRTSTIFHSDTDSATLLDLSGGSVLYFCCNTRTETGSIFLHSLTSGTTERLPFEVTTGDSARITGNGRFVLVRRLAGGSYLLDTQDGTGVPVQLRNGATDISNNGRWVIYTKSGTDPNEDEPSNITNVFVEDLVSGGAYLLSKGLAGSGLTDFAKFPFFTGFDNAIYFLTASEGLVNDDNNTYHDVYRYDFDD